MAGKERIRVDIWTSLKPVIEAEIERTGLTANELINIALCDYFGLSPIGKKQTSNRNIAIEEKSSPDDEDYI
jgi:hypothetical protein